MIITYVDISIFIGIYIYIFDYIYIYTNNLETYRNLV